MLNKKSIYNISKNSIPHVETNLIPNSYRHNVIDSLRGDKNVGIELGVARGIFSKRMVDSAKFRKFFGVDVYSDMHDTEEYKSALKKIGLENNYSLLRMRFDEALNLFDDNYFDFIYIDGFAHTGEEGGQTLIDWVQKLKTGGVFAGDDYHDDWPLVKWAINDFVKKTNSTLYITEKSEDTAFCNYPSWFIIKGSPKDFTNLKVSERLLHLAKSEKHRIHRQRTLKIKLRKYIIKMLDFLGLKEKVKSIKHNIQNFKTDK